MAVAAFNPRTLALPKAERVQIAKHAAAVRWGRARRRFWKQMAQVDGTAAKAWGELTQGIAALPDDQARGLLRAARRLLAAYCNRSELLGRDLPEPWQAMIGVTIQELRRKAKEEH